MTEKLENYCCMKSNTNKKVYSLNEDKTIQQNTIFGMGQLYPSESLRIIIVPCGLVCTWDDIQYTTTNIEVYDYR